MELYPEGHHRYEPRVSPVKLEYHGMAFTALEGAELKQLSRGFAEMEPSAFPGPALRLPEPGEDTATGSSVES